MSFNEMPRNAVIELLYSLWVTILDPEWVLININFVFKILLKLFICFGKKFIF